MMNDSADDNQISSTNLVSKMIQEVDQSLIGPMMTVISLKSDQPSQLIDFAGNDKSLQLLAQNLHQLLSSPNAVIFSAENKQNLELIIQTFITDSFKKSTKKIEDLKHCQSDLKKLQKELFESKNRIENYKYLLSNSEKAREELLNENKDLQGKIDSLYQNQAVSINKMKKIKQEYENQITDIKKENCKLKDKLSQMEDDSTINKYASQRNREQFNDLASQTTKYNEKIQKLKEQIKKKNKQIKNLYNENQKLKLANQMLEDDSQKMKATLNTTRADLDQMKQKVSGETNENSDKRSKERQLSEAKNYEQLQSAIISISDQFKKQSEELIQLRKSHMLCTTLLHKQVEMVSEYEKQIFTCEKAIKQNSSLSNELGSTKEELIHALESLNSKVKFIRSLMSVCKVDKEEELPLYFIKLQDYGIIENRRLVAAFEDNLRFMTNLFNSSLVYDDQNIPLNEDKQFINSLQFEVSRTRQFILENTANNENESQSNLQLDSDSNGNNSNSNNNLIKGNSTNNNIEDSNEINEEEMILNQNRTDLAILTSQILRNEILRKYSENLKHNSDAFLQVAKILGCPDNFDSASKIILENESMIKSFIDEALKLIKDNTISDDKNDNFVEEEEEINSENTDRKRIFDEILEFIETNKSLIDEIKNSLKFEGEVNEIPLAIEQMVLKNEMLSNQKDKNHRNVSDPETNKEQVPPRITSKSIEIDEQDKDLNGKDDNSDKNITGNNSSKKESENNGINQNDDQKNYNNNDNNVDKNNNSATKSSQNDTNKNNNKKKNNNDNDIVDEDTDQIILEATHQLKKGNNSNNEPKTDWKKRIHSCVVALKKLNDENKSLKQQLNKANQHIKDIEKRSSTKSKTLTMMTDSYKGLEKYNNELLQKNRDLLLEIENKNKQADERVIKVLDQEREQHVIELKNIQNKSHSIIDRLKARVEEKKKKIIALKKKLKEVIVSYDDAFKQQKSTIAYLRKQLDKSISSSNNNEILKEVQQLNSQLKASESERHNLEMKIDQIKDENMKSQDIRETFWKAQIVMVEQNLQQEVEKEKQNILETIAAQFNCEPTLSSILNSYYLRDTTNNDTDNFPRDLSKNSKIETQVQIQLNEWEKWGRSLFTSLKNGEVFKYNSNDLRFMLSEMVMSSISQRYLLNRLESLRTQKRILLSLNASSQKIELSNTDSIEDIRSLLIFSIFIIRVKKNLTYLPLQKNQDE